MTLFGKRPEVTPTPRQVKPVTIEVGYNESTGNTTFTCGSIKYSGPFDEVLAKAMHNYDRMPGQTADSIQRAFNAVLKD